MILATIATLLLIAAVVLPGSLLMKYLMDVLAPRTGIFLAGVLTSVVGAGAQLGWALVLLHLVAFLL